MDGTEDDILWEDIDESSEDESSGDDPAAAVDADTETNPYDDIGGVLGCGSPPD